MEKQDKKYEKPKKEFKKEFVESVASFSIMLMLTLAIYLMFEFKLISTFNLVDLDYLDILFSIILIKIVKTVL